MRIFLITIFAVGVIASMLGHLPSQRAQQEVITVSTARSTDDVGRTQNVTAESTSQDGALDIPRSGNGHFYADVDVNGSKLHMLVDTGASQIALSREDARSAGIATSIGMPNIIGEGADGSVHGEVATADSISLGNAKAESMPVLVLNSG